MRKFLKKSIFFGLMLLFSMVILVPGAEARTHKTRSNDVKVRSYTKKNGVRVNGYYRSKKDNSVKNNYSCIDNGNCTKSSKKSGEKINVKTQKISKTNKKSRKKRR